MSTKAKRAENDDVDEVPSDMLAKFKTVGYGPRNDRCIPLSYIRERKKITQAEVAKRAGMAQSEVSRIESRSDCLVSTLAHYTEVLGGRLRLIIELDGHSFPVCLK